MKHYAVYMMALMGCLIAHSNTTAQGNQEHLPENATGYALSYNGRNTFSDQGKPIYLNDISTKAVTDFKTRFKDVDDERWQKQSTGGFVATFKKNNVRCIVWYSTKGRWESTLKGYNETMMPFEVRDVVKRTYYDYSITHIDEIVTLNGGPVPTYLVYIELKNRVKIIRVKDGVMDIFKEITKQ